jgi:hypothetical protein
VDRDPRGVKTTPEKEYPIKFASSNFRIWPKTFPKGVKRGVFLNFFENPICITIRGIFF